MKTFVVTFKFIDFKGNIKVQYKAFSGHTELQARESMTQYGVNNIQGPFQILKVEEFTSQGHAVSNVIANTPVQTDVEDKEEPRRRK